MPKLSLLFPSGGTLFTLCKFLRYTWKYIAQDFSGSLGKIQCSCHVKFTVFCVPGWMDVKGTSGEIATYTVRQIGRI